MKFRLTASQRKVLQSYWETGRPFNLDTLLRDRVFSFRFTARYSLWRMKRKNQIIQVGAMGWYVATTDSPQEWNQLHLASKMNPFSCDASFSNRYEAEEAAEVIRNVISNIQSGKRGAK